MSKKIYQECEGCNNKFPIDSMLLNSDCDWTCEECIEEAKKDRRVHNILFWTCLIGSFVLAYCIFKSCTK